MSVAHGVDVENEAAYAACQMILLAIRENTAVGKIISSCTIILI